jgi:DNA polymerase-3 subunit delta
MEQYQKIITDLKAKKIKPIYLIMGEESYYIDQLVDYIEDHLLPEEDKSFNQVVLYGRDVTVDQVLETAKRYPMMADKQLVIVKEAQDLKDIKLFENYAENPLETTVLVLAHKYKNVLKTTKFYKNCVKNGVVLESEKIKDYKLSQWIEGFVKSKGYQILPKAALMLSEFLGNDLNKINNELNKLFIILKPNEPITPEAIEKNIGFSKDFNVFELQNAIGTKNEVKTLKIFQHFAQNSKEYPMVVISSMLFSYLSKILLYHGLPNKTDAASVLRISPYFVKDYQEAARNFPMRKVSNMINALKTLDIKSKGVGDNQVPDIDLYKDFMVEVFRV